jgi:GST-like protein
MSIVFYSAPMSSASPVASALAELEVPHEVVTFDLSRSDHKRPEFLALNPNGKVPTLVVDGTPMFEALAILIYLGERFGVDKGLWPAEHDPRRLQALAWCSWAYVTYGSVIGRVQFAASPRVDPALHHAGQAEFARKQLYELLAILEARLSKQPYMLGETYSLVDLTVASVINYSTFFCVSLESHPHVKAWVERFQDRPSYKQVMQGAA